MASIKQRVFRGGFLRSEADLLLAEQATEARDCILDSGKIRPMQDVAFVKTLASAGRKSAYLYDWDGAPADNWLTWTDRVKVHKGPIALDAYNRIYWTESGTPKVLYTLDTALAATLTTELGTPYAAGQQTEKRVGVPQAAAAPTVATQSKSTDTWSRQWGWWWEDAAGNRYDVNRASLRWAAGQWTLSAGAEYVWFQTPGNKPEFIYENGVEMTEGTVGSLAAGQWGWVAGTRRLYVRLSDSTDPDAKALHYVTGQWEYITDSTAAIDYLRFKNIVAGTWYQISAAASPYPITAVATATRLAYWFQAVDVNTGRIMGRTYPAGSDWESDSDLRISGSTVSLDETYDAYNATYDLKMYYDASDSSDYEADRIYFFTTVNILGEEGPPSPLSDTIGVMTNQDVLVSALPTTSPAGGYIPLRYKRLYRRVLSDAGAAYQQVVRLYDPSTPASAIVTDGNIPLSRASVLDESDDTELGDVCPTGDPLIAGSYWNPPPDGLMGLVPCPGSFFAGFEDQTVWFCEIGYPYAWPTRYAINMPIQVVDLGVTGNTVTALCEGLPQLITVPAPGTVTHAEVPNTQAMLNDVALSDGGGVYFASQDGLCVISGMIVTVMTEPFMTKEGWQARVPSSAILALYDRWLICFCTGGSFMLRVGDPVTGIVELTDAPTGVWHDQKTDSLYLIVGDELVKWQAGTTNRAYTWTSKEYLFPRPIDWRAAKLTAESYPSASQPTMTLIGEGVTAATQAFSSDAARLIPVVRRGKRWKYTLTGTTAIDEFVLTQSMGDL